jgi:TP901 family phage tail tape measure protein
MIVPFNVGEISVSITADNSPFMRALNETHQAGGNWATQMGNKMQNVGGQMRTLGSTASMYLTAPILGVGVASGKMFMDFEKSMSEVTGLVGVSKEQVSQWSDELLKLGPALGKTPQELADALYFITSAGLRGAEAMEVLEMSAKASAAGLGETKVIADLVTSAMNAYGSENISAAQATDILVGAVREGKAEAADMAASMGQVLPISSAMGVEFWEVAAAAAAMTRTGTDAATANMQLKNIMMGLLKPSEQANKALETMGTSAGELRQKIKDDGLLSTLMHLKDLTNEYGEDIMAQVFPNIRSLLGVLDLMGENIGDNIELFGRMEDTTGLLEKAFESAAETARFKWNQAIAESQASLITLGDAVMSAAIPVMQELVGVIKSLTEWFKGLDEEQQQNIIRWAGITAAIGPVLIISGTLISSLGTLLKLFGGLGSALIHLPGMFTKTAASMATISTAASGMAAAAGAATTLTTAATSGLVDQYGRAISSSGAFTGATLTTKAAMGGLGTKLTAMAAAGGPILGIAAALGIGAVYWSEYTKAMARDYRTFEQVASDVLNSMNSQFLSGYASMIDAQESAQTAMLESQIAFLEAKEALTEEEAQQLADLRATMLVVEEEAAEKRKAIMLIREKELGDAIKDETIKSQDEIVSLFNEHKQQQIDDLAKWQAEERQKVIDHHAAMGTVGTEAFWEDNARVDREHAERLALINAQLGEILAEYETELAKIGLVYDEELGKLIPIQDKWHAELASKLTSDMAEMKTQYGVLSRANVAEYRRGIEDETPATEAAARNTGTRSRTALKEGSADTYSLGVSFSSGFEGGIASKANDLVNTAVKLVSDAYNAAKNWLESRSPSQKTWRLGEDWGAGLAGGINASENLVRSASEGIASKAVQPLIGVGQQISDMVNSWRDIPSNSSGSSSGNWFELDFGKKSSTGNWWNLQFEKGGIVPGPIGAPQLAMVHGGETILPTHKTGSLAQNINNNFSLEGLFAGATINMGSDQDAKALAREIYRLADTQARSEGVML